MTPIRPASGTAQIAVIREASARDAAAAAVAAVAAGDIPLVVDDRLGADRARDIAAEVARFDVPEGAAIATMTSGSTDRSRIVVRSLESWSSSFGAIEHVLELSRDDVLYLPSPPCSSLSLFSVVHAATAGFELALPSRLAVRPRDFAEATAVHCTPSSFRSILDAIDEGAPHRLRVALLGGSREPEGLRARAAARGIRVVSYYGAAELSFVAVDTDGSGLRAFAGVELDCREGILWVRSPFAALGYLDGEGPLERVGEWMSVGDRARIDDGRLQLLGRADGAILSASATIIPADVERAIERARGVTEAIVLGIANERLGALVAAVIEASEVVSLAELRASVADLLPSHRPRRWYLAPGMERTPSGKPDRALVLGRIGRGELVPLVD